MNVAAFMGLHVMRAALFFKETAIWRLVTQA
jgi:hypothetical protein